MDEYFSSILGTLPEMKTKEPEVFIPIIPLWLIYILACIPLLWCIIYYISNLLMSLLGPVDMKKKYNAKWALVTGAGTGIGKSLAETMALQGLNVVLVSLPDVHLINTTKELQKKYPKLEFRSVSVKFDHKTDYLPDIIEATNDIDVTIIFNNAGYIVTGFFDHTTLDAQLANMECNATACVKITHHFIQQMLQKKLKGCFIYTSSISGFIPNPFGVIYGATKAFVSQFAASLAVEVRNHGIDVIAVHPLPVASNFFDKAHKLAALDFFKLAAVSPDAVPWKILSCVGRCHLGDLGILALLFRSIVACFPYDFLAGVISFFAPIMGDYNDNNHHRGVVQKLEMKVSSTSTSSSLSTTTTTKISKSKIVKSRSKSPAKRK
jgi:short-subunit dehydrogenase